MRDILMLTAASLALAACSNDKAGEAPQTASAGATAGPTAPTGPVTRDQVYAAAGVGAEAFVTAIYAQYVNGGPQGEPPVPGQDPMFSRTMNALIGADVRAAKGEVPSLNYDPFCACQDQGDFVVRTQAVAQSDPNAAEANIAFTNMGEQTSLTLKLVREGPNWKVDDIIDGSDSLHDTLMAVAEAAG